MLIDAVELEKIQIKLAEKEQEAQELTQLRGKLGDASNRNVRELYMGECMVHLCRAVQLLGLHRGYEFESLDYFAELIESFGESYIDYAKLSDLPEFENKRIKGRERKQAMESLIQKIQEESAPVEPAPGGGEVSPDATDPAPVETKTPTRTLEVQIDDADGSYSAWFNGLLDGKGITEYRFDSSTGRPQITAPLTDEQIESYVAEFAKAYPDFAGIAFQELSH